MYKKYIFIFLLFALHRLAAQTWTFEPQAVRDTFTTTVYVNYGDSAALGIFDRLGRVRKDMISMKIHTHNIFNIDTLLDLTEGVYFPFFLQPDGKRSVKKIVCINNNSIIHFKIKLIINPESIPAETFTAYPNPVENGEINLLYSQDWANGIVTISNNIGQILFTKSLTEIQNNQLKINELPTGNYILTIKTATKHHSQIIAKK